MRKLFFYLRQGDEIFCLDFSTTNFCLKNLWNARAVKKCRACFFVRNTLQSFQKWFGRNFWRMEKFTDQKILLLLCFVLFFLGNQLIPVTDPTECCYTLTAKEMLEAGDYFSPRIYGDYWYDKPIFFYWELIFAYKIFGVNEFASRFFPAIFSTLGIFLTYFFATKIYNRRTGFFSAIILATSLEYWYIAHAIITDATLFCCISITLMTFFIAYRDKNFKLYYIAYIFSGIAILTKGPIGFFLPGLIILIFLAVQKDLKHLLKMNLPKGLAITFLIAAIWYLPMYFLHGQIFLENFLGVHNFLRATVPEHPETNVFYYYTAIFLLGFLPYNLPVLFGLGKKFLREKNFPALDMRKKFLLIWAATVFVVFQSFATKYITYTFPYMMPIAILFAEFFLDRQKIFYRLVTGAVIFFIAAFFVALPICEENSGKQTAKIISPLIDKNSCVVSFAKGYSGSLVFYLDHKVYRLETLEKFKKLKPDKMSWTSLNVMPFLEIKNLPRDKKIIAVVEDQREKEFLKIVKGNWKFYKQIDDKKIYLRNAD